MRTGTERALQKNELRSSARDFRNSLSPVLLSAIDARIAGQVRMLEAWSNADIIFSYLSIGCEVDTHELIRCAWEANKIVAVPRVVAHSRRLEWYCLEDFSHLEVSNYGLKQPYPNPITRIEPAESSCNHIALVPALTFDKCGYRIGYGGGFYDVFLSGFSGISIGLGRRIEMKRDLSGLVGPHDVAVDIVVTEDGICTEKSSKAKANYSENTKQRTSVRCPAGTL